MAENSKEGKNKKITITEVAKRAGVSVGTVSHALNNVGYVNTATREKVQKAAEELGYVPNRAGRILKTKKTGLIMMAIPDTSNEIYFGMIQSMLKFTKQNGYSMLLYYTNGEMQEELKTLQLLKEHVVDGLFLVHFSYDQRILEEVRQANRPVVLCGMCNHLWANHQEPFDTVSIDVYEGIYAAVRHLVQMGHQKIGYLAGKLGTEVYQQRYQAYQDALEEFKLEFREDYVLWNDYSER